MTVVDFKHVSVRFKETVDYSGDVYIETLVNVSWSRLYPLVSQLMYQNHKEVALGIYKM